MTKRPTRIDDLLRFSAPSEPRLSPDGRWVAFLVKTVDAAKNRYRVQLHLVPADGSAAARCLTRGENVSGHQWMPDSQSLVFQRAEDKKAQLWQLSLAGGEAERLTDLPAGAVGELAIDPTGEIILFSFRPADPEYGEAAMEERKKTNRSTPPRVLTRLRWRQEGSGFLARASAQLYTFTVATCTAAPLTEGDRDYLGYCWSPEGQRLAYLQNVAPDPDQRGGAVGLFVRTRDNSTPQALGPIGPKSGLTWSPDGQWLAFLGHENADDTWGTSNYHPWVVSLATGEARDLAPDWDVTLGDLALGEVYGRGDVGPCWSAESDALAFVASDQGEVGVYAVRREGGIPRKFTPEQCSEVGFSIAAGRTATLRLTSQDAGDIYVDDRRLTELNAELMREVALIEPQAVTVGEVPCLVLVPEGPGPHPTVLYIHGGPHLMYGRWHLFHEYQALAAAGYTVIYPNPRGSRGYGEAWTNAIRGNWGPPAMEDCLSCVDHAIVQGWSDPERLAVMGGSYGGYLTAWIIGHTDRFACAIAERGVYNLVSFGGTTDFVPGENHYFAGNHTDDTAALQRNSPLTYANRVTTPLLVVHSEGDLRCPVSQGDEYFRAVRRASPAEVQYLRFGSEGSHELSRGGPPDLRIERQERFHAWLAAHLQSDRPGRA